MMYNFSEVYIYSDQPTTCPKCGSRTEIIISLSDTIEHTQFHKCNVEGCNYEFVMQEDIEITN
jgi:hypothetical protein